jgi:DNA-binding response OmpR family regulator
MAQDRVIGDLSQQFVPATPSNHKHELERRECSMCPSCGYNLRAEAPFKAGDFAFDPRGDATWKGRTLGFTTQEHLFMGALVMANGRIVPKGAMANRISEDAQDKIVDVIICKVRAKLVAAGAPVSLVETVWGKGTRFNNPKPKVAGNVIMGRFPTVRIRPNG